MSTAAGVGRGAPAVRRLAAPIAAPATPTHEAERLHYVDALRLGAVALVIVVHVAEVFNPWDEWHITNGARSRAAGELAALAAPWVMPLLMLLAGVSAWFSLARRDNAAYVRDRVLRVLLPLAVGTLLLVPPQVYLERRLNGEFEGSLVAFYPHFFDGIYPRGNLSWHHLWFLAHLFAYSLLALPLFRYWQRPGRARAMHWLARICAAPGGLFWLAIPLVLERHLLWGLFRERHMLTSDWSNHALLFAAYVYGFLLAGSPWLGAAIDAQWRRALAVAVVGSIGIGAGAWFGLLPARLPAPYSAVYLGFWTLYAMCAWAWMVALLGVGRRWLNRDDALLRYGCTRGYPVYIVHQPIIVAGAYVIVQSELGVGVKFWSLLAFSVIATIGSADLIARVPDALRAVRRAMRQRPQAPKPSHRRAAPGIP